MKIFGLVRWTKWENGERRTFWVPDFEDMELFLTESDRDKRLLELNGEKLTDIVRNPTAKSFLGGISLEDELEKYVWWQPREDFPPCSFEDAAGHPVENGPYVPFSQDLGPVPHFEWQINSDYNIK